MVLHATRIWDKVEAIWSDYSKRKRSILRVHHMKLHGKLNASVFLLEIDTFLNEQWAKSASYNEAIKTVESSN